VDRGKPGSKIHALSDRVGLPLAVGVSAANTNDHHALQPLVKAIPAVRSRRGPRRARPTKLHADKAYDVTELRGWLRQREIVTAERYRADGSWIIFQDADKQEVHRLEERDVRSIACEGPAM
jgi:hypothetical protein